MKLLDKLLKRRTIRRYKDKKVSDEKIEYILKGALTAPSGCNLKPIEIVVVEDKKTLERLADSRGKSSRWIKDAPLGFVLVCKEDVSTTWVSDASIVAILIQMLGEDLNLGSCWLHAENKIADDGSNVEDNIKEILDLPNNYRVHSMISMGYKDETKENHNVDNLEYERIHYNKFNKKN